MNAIQRRVEAVFSATTKLEAEILTGLFEERAGHKPFRGTLPVDAAGRKWITASWKRTYVDNSIDDITATFHEVLDPG